VVQERHKSAVSVARTSIALKVAAGVTHPRLVVGSSCYGLRNIERFFQRLILDVDGYRRFSPWHDTAISRLFTASLEEPAQLAE
jgi:hypothetical protein